MRTILRDNYTPELGDYHEIIVRDEANNKVWLFDCDGVYSDITAGDTGPRRSSVVDVVDTPADLDTYDKSSLVVGDTIIVMNEVTGLDRVKTSIYRLNELKQFEKIDNVNYQDGPAFCAADGLSFTSGTAGDPCTFMLRGVTMSGATSLADGAMGMVPQPLAADRLKYLRGDGTWQEVAAPISLVNGYLDAPTTPGSAISANGIGFEIFGRKPGSGTATLIDYSKVRMHKNASITHPDVGGWSYVVLGEASVDSTNCGVVAIGCGDIDEGGAWVEGDSAIGIGAGAWAQKDSSIAIGHNAYAANDNNSALAGNIAIGNNVEANWSGAIAMGWGTTSSGSDSVAIGNSAVASGSGALALGMSATASSNGAITFPYGYDGGADGVMNIGVYNTSFGYSNSNYRLITGVHDPVAAHDAVTKGYVDVRILLNAGAPSTSTVGTVGQLLSDTANGALYQCTAVDTTDPNNPVYTWDLVGGGGGPTVVQTTGQSTTDVMSQKAVTDTLFYNNDPKKIIITKFDTNQNPGQYSTALNGTITNGATYSFSTAGGRAYANHTINMGQYATSSGQYGISIGMQATAGGDSSIAIGRSAQAGWNIGCVAIGANSGDNITTGGMVDVGSSNTYTGYDGTSNYRVITGVHDAQNAHDAVTLGQLSSLVTLINTLLNTNIVINNGVISDGNSNQNSPAPAPTYPYTSGTLTYYLYNGMEVYVDQTDADQNLYYSSDNSLAINGGEWSDNGDGTVSSVGSGGAEPEDPGSGGEPGPEIPPEDNGGEEPVEDPGGEEAPEEG